MSNETGGPAFPVEQFNPHSEQGRALDWQSEGMTLRDYFAAKIAAAQSVATSADTDYMNPLFVKSLSDDCVAQRIAKIAYAVADAMLAERAK